MMKKKVIALAIGLLSVCFLIGMAAVPAKAAQRFNDVPEDAYYAEAVNWAATNNLVQGYPDGTFGADKPITGAEVATILWRLGGSKTSSVSNGGSAFDNTWYGDALIWSVEQNLLARGTSPGKSISRMGALDMLWKYEGSPFPASPIDIFEDYNWIPEEITSYISLLWGNSYDIVRGVTATAFHPHEDCTRGQFVTMLYRDQMLSSRAVQIGEHLYHLNANDVRLISVRNYKMYTDEQNGAMYPRYEEFAPGSEEFTTILNAVNAFAVNAVSDHTGILGGPDDFVKIEMIDGKIYRFGFECAGQSVTDVDPDDSGCCIAAGHAVYGCDEDVLSPVLEIIRSLE